MSRGRDVNKEKQLLVEGKDDIHVVINLMRHHGVIWDNENEPPPVEVIERGGKPRLLDRTKLRAALKGSELKILGIMVDADEDFLDTWESVRGCLSSVVHDLPIRCPNYGYIVDIPDEIRLGVWIMPDNASSGMLETFVERLMPAVGSNAVWDYTKEVIEEAKRKGADYKDTQRAKARVHTWLSWTDEPGNPLGLALNSEKINPNGPEAEGFVSWFERLYGL